MQHQFWITKKVVQRKFGSKEDEHIISSDAELDAKIEVFKSISDTSAALNKIIDQYQESLCVLSQEECVFGRFLKEVGKRSKTTGISITNTGKAVSYSGQQRMCVRMPLLRLHHEVEVFRCRAVRDTQATIQSMEKERTEYRAALSWMKSASSELDPDTGRGLDKFRVAQSHVRAAKQHFDGLSMDSIQKIDLLAAARCNMFSHALVAYMTELKQFAQKTACTFNAISKSLLLKPKYDFCVLKDLTQDTEIPNDTIEEIKSVDNDQLLYFADEYIDEPAKNQPQEPENENTLIDITHKINDIITPSDTNSSRLLELTNCILTDQQIIESDASLVPKVDNLAEKNANNCNEEKLQKIMPESKPTKTNGWMELFAELDPLANPEAFDMKLNGGRNNFQQT